MDVYACAHMDVDMKRAFMQKNKQKQKPSM